LILPAAALLLVLVATTLAVYKPRGLTPDGQRTLHRQRREQEEERPAAAR
jgi:hypothetical protein